MDNKNNQFNNHNKLEEGQEVSLNLPEPAHKAEPEPITTPNSGSTSRIVDPTKDPATNTEFKPELQIEIVDKPKINLSPKVLPPQDRGMPINEKQRKALSKLQKIRKHKHWYNIKLVVGTVLVFVLIFNSQWFISQFMYLFSRPQTTSTETPSPSPTQPQPSPTPEQPQDPAEVVGPQNEIIIPKIGVRAPLVFIDTNQEIDVLKALRDGVVHYYGTAYPGEVGNSVFFGHSSNDWWEPGGYKFVFVLLEKLVPGDQYEIHYNSRKYVYTVTETKVVEPTDLSVLNQTTEPTSTLITCTPPGTSWRRFIVHAKQVSPSPSIAQQTQSTTQPNQSGTLPATTSGGNTQLPSAPPSIWDQIVIFFNNLFGDRNEKPNNDQSSTTIQRLPEVN